MLSFQSLLNKHVIIFFYVNAIVIKKFRNNDTLINAQEERIILIFSMQDYLKLSSIILFINYIDVNNLILSRHISNKSFDTINHI